MLPFVTATLSAVSPRYMSPLFLSPSPLTRSDPDQPLLPEIEAYLVDHVAADQLHWRHWVATRVKPARIYLGNQSVKHEVMVMLASAAELFLPRRFRALNPGPGALRELLLRFGDRVLPRDLIDGCLAERSEEWWLARAGKTLWHWAIAFILIGHIQPSSAAAERGFSVFERVFGPQ